MSQRYQRPAAFQDNERPIPQQDGGEAGKPRTGNVQEEIGKTIFPEPAHEVQEEGYEKKAYAQGANPVRYCHNRNLRIFNLQ
jgi:hypothetical protein